MDEEVAKVVAETTAQITAGKSKSEQKVSVGGDLIESQVRDNEIQSVANKVADGTAGQALISDKVEGLKSWQIYWDVTTKAYVINDPRIVTPMGTMVVQSVAIEANKTYTAQVWLNSEGVWNAAIVTNVEPKEGAVSETCVEIAVVGALTGPNQIQQRHVGAIVISSAGGGGGGGIKVKIGTEIKSAEYLEFATEKYEEESSTIPLPKVEVVDDGKGIRVTLYTKDVDVVTGVEFKEGKLVQHRNRMSAVMSYYDISSTEETVFQTINHSDI